MAFSLSVQSKGRTFVMEAARLNPSLLVEFGMQWGQSPTEWVAGPSGGAWELSWLMLVESVSSRIGGLLVEVVDRRTSDQLTIKAYDLAQEILLDRAASGEFGVVDSEYETVYKFCTGRAW